LEKFVHETVFARELVDGLELKPGSIAIDCTAGGGGHTALMVAAVGTTGKVIAIDQDDTAIATLAQRFGREVESGIVQIVKSRFSALRDVCKSLGIVGEVGGIAADLGVSSPQLDRGERGFSFVHDGPLDMRMDRASSRATARDVVNTLERDELKRIFREFGEEPKAHFVAEAICANRERKPIETTLELAKIVADSIHYAERSRRHPATKVFQALRIYVNGELDELRSLLDDGFGVLAKGGRIGIISFHSLEDRYVKEKFKDLAKSPSANIPRGVPVSVEDLRRLGDAQGKIIKPFPMVADDSESERNVRARSAKLRILEKN
jgi:16S rRNA (cytosine1402-N4)-methyltransferase